MYMYIYVYIYEYIPLFTSSQPPPVRLATPVQNNGHGVYICMHTCMYICKCTYMYIYCIYTWINIFFHSVSAAASAMRDPTTKQIHTDKINIYEYMCIYMYVCMYIYIYIYIYTYAPTNSMCIYQYIDAYVYIDVFRLSHSQRDLQSQYGA